MASGLLSPLLSSARKLLDLLWSSAAASGDPQGEHSTFPADLQRLERLLRRIQATLDDVGEREVQESYVKLWIAELTVLARDAEDVLDDYRYEMLRRRVQELQGSAAAAASSASRKRNHDEDGSISERIRKITRRFQISTDRAALPLRPEEDDDGGTSERIGDIIRRFEEISRDRAALQLGPDVGRRIAWRDSQWESRSSSHLFDESLVFGRADEKERVIELVLSCSQGSKTHVLPVVGMGGIGKTTMAQMVYNDGRVQERFDLRGWVHVSETFDLRRLTIAIYESLTRGPCEYSELSSVHDVLKQKLCGKSVFMVLDDLWNERQSFWQDLLCPLKDAESVMILVTTRSKEVARLVQTVEPLVLGSLSEEHCWLLFQHYAFGDRIIDEESSLVQVGRKIMQKCGGLPLAVKSIGCLLRSKRNMQTWLEISESEFWEYSDDNDEIFCALRLSFYRLPARLKPCFLLCVLYPKGEPFTKDDMIHLWIAHGYIQTTGCKTPERIAGEYFDELNERSLIEPYLVHLDIRERPSFWKNSPGIRGSQSIRNANNGISLLETDASYSDIISLLETSLGTTKASLAFRNFRLHDMTWELAKSLSTSLLSAVVVDGGSLYLGQNMERLPFLVGGGRQNTHRYNTYNQINGSPGIGMNPSGQKNWLIDSMDDHVNLMSVACSTGNKHVNILTIENRVSQLHDMNYLRTLMLKQCTFFHIGIHEYRYLRILVLDSCNSGCISATQYLKLLRYLHVSNCDSMFGKNLKHLTESICHLYSLEKLIVTTCWKEFSMTSCHLFSLRYLQLSVRFSDWSLHPFCQFYNLDTLCLKKCDSIADLPICIGNLMSLKRLQLIQISNIKKLDHYSFRCQSNSYKSDLTKAIFPALEELEFDSLCDLQDWCGLQDSDCPKIQNITLRNCYKLRRIPYFGSVRNLIIRKLALADLQLSAYNELSQLQTLDIRYCKNLKSLMGLKNLCSLGSLYIAHCPQLIVLCKDKLPFRPQHVFVDDCPGLKEWCDEQELYYQAKELPALRLPSELVNTSVLEADMRQLSRRTRQRGRETQTGVARWKERKDLPSNHKAALQAYSASRGKRLGCATLGCNRDASRGPQNGEDFRYKMGKGIWRCLFPIL
ncbi:hypothetical protein PAHAL_5G311100 [Panicum hallii]|uniref:NB-ARC domain-containing protein n=1 Tax=Panicum hallii TaxID=206008 RepID=A0A2T8ILV9_9POAL|nr:putative disease resistance protein RGA3 isoform X2 [Panicum hallii]PVH38639.1 hypothetical protein PAHAL_5G311100 [Panicum hallii]